MDILDQLFLRNATETLQIILFFLDFKSLHDARTVNKKWNKIISEIVWDSNKGRGFLKRQRILKWMKKVPKVTACDFYDEMFVYKRPWGLWDAVANSFDVDEKILVCGLSHVVEGGAKVIDVESRTIITHLNHQKSSSRQNVRKRAVTDVVLTKNWIVTATEERIFTWSRDNYELVKDFVIHGGWDIDLSATESKKHLFIAFQHYDFTNNVYRISPKDIPHNDSSIENLKPRVILSNGVLVSCDTTNNEHTLVDKSNLTLTIYNLEVSGLEMFKLASNQVLNTYHSIGKVRDGISYPYFVHPEQNLNVQGEDKGYFSVSIWNLQTRELVKRLHFNFEKDGDPGGVMLRSDILVIRFKEYDDKVKFYIYNINQKKGSDFSSHSPSFNIIHREKEEGINLFRLNNFSIIENIDDSFVFTDFC